MAYQGMTVEESKVDIVLELAGQDIMGIPLNAPLTSHKIVYTLPMLTIKEDKGILNESLFSYLSCYVFK